MKKHIPLIIVIIISCGSFGLLCWLCVGSANRIAKPHNYSKELYNMANTVSPIIDMIAEKTGNYGSFQGSEVAIGGKLIYKREPIENVGGIYCISGFGNVYYIRIYEWGWEGDKLWYRPTHDVPLNVFSCIDEKDVLIPYWDKRLQNAELGIKYYH